MTTIRGATADDLDALERLAAAAEPERWTRDALAKELRLPLSRVWIAERAATAVGFSIIWLVADEIQLHYIATAPEARRTGVARALMHRLLQRGADPAIRHIDLEVSAANTPARRLYQQLGFQQTGQRKHYYPDQTDALLLRWTQPSTGSDPDDYGKGSRR